MRLPEELRQGIEQQAGLAPAREMVRAAGEISDAYRTGNFAEASLRSAAHRLAYLQVRMPATFAACAHVFEHLREVMPDFAPHSLLDLGAGPGTASWAAVEQFPSLASTAMVERDAELVRIGQALASSQPVLSAANWTTGDLRNFVPQPCDVVVAAYALGEMTVSDAKRVMRASLQAAQVFVLIEPGTPNAFARVAELRRLLIAEEATIAAPCPHERACPLLTSGDWCHFSERLERSAEHRRVKGGSLGYEDEKFSYLCATRLPIAERMGRIVRHSQIHSGYVQLQVCAPDELKQVTVTKSRGGYREARRAKWGDRWETSS